MVCRTESHITTNTHTLLHTLSQTRAHRHTHSPGWFVKGLGNLTPLQKPATDGGIDGFERELFSNNGVSPQIRSSNNISGIKK